MTRAVTLLCSTLVPPRRFVRRRFCTSSDGDFVQRAGVSWPWDRSCQRDCYDMENEQRRVCVCVFLCVSVCGRGYENAIAEIHQCLMPTCFNLVLFKSFLLRSKFLPSSWFVRAFHIYLHIFVSVYCKKKIVIATSQIVSLNVKTFSGTILLNYDSDSLYDMLTKIRWAGDDCIPPHAPCGFSQISNKLGA